MSDDDGLFGVELERKQHHHHHHHHRHYSHHSYGVSDSQSQHNIMSTMISEDIITLPVMSKSLYILL